MNDNISEDDIIKMAKQLLSLAFEVSYEPPPLTSYAKCKMCGGVHYAKDKESPNPKAIKHAGWCAVPLAIKLLGESQVLSWDF